MRVHRLSQDNPELKLCRTFLFPSNSSILSVISHLDRDPTSMKSESPSGCNSLFVYGFRNDVGPVVRWKSRVSRVDLLSRWRQEQKIQKLR
ncbi:unnamed protein product [Larinioides sclopetarius]|uniref:Uncharacterized protein n=1 Tax=Larinioides sclopetarius TaxID=280406 RepID=A0AAV2A7X5_9ARAC